MRLKGLIKSKGVFFTWFFSYISILLVPILITFGIYNIYQRTMEEEISKANMSLLKQVQTLMDARLYEVEQLAMEISLNPRVNIAVNVKDSFLSKDQMNLYEVVQDFKVYKASNSFIDDCFLYMNNTNSAIESGSFMSGEFLYEFYFDQTGMNYEQWTEYIGRRHQRTIESIVKKNLNDVTYNTLAYMQSIPIESPNECLGTIIITINEESLKEIIENINWLDHGAVFILDNNNRILMSAGSVEKQESIDYKTLGEGSLLKHIYVNGQEMAVASVDSEVMPWKYVTIVPSKIFWEKAQNMRQLIWYGILGCIVLGGVVAYFFTNLNYIPINNMVKAFAYRKNYILKKPYNEYEFIQEAINSTLKLQDKMEDKIAQQNKVLKTNFLLHLLKGELQEEFLAETDFPAYGISFEGENFVVVLFYLNSYVYSYELSQFIIQNIFEELINKEFNGYMVKIDELMACIINGEMEIKDEMLEHIESIINDTKNILLNEFNISVKVTVSNIHDTLIGISQGYKEAFNAMEYGMILDFKDTEDIIYYKHIQSSHKKYLYSIETEQKLINNIKIGDYERTTKLLDEIFEIHFSTGYTSIEMGKCLIFDLVGTLIKALDSCESEELLENLRPVQKLIKLNNIQSMKQEIYDFIKTTCDYMKNKKKEEKKGELEEKVKLYILENYSDKNLSVSMLGEKFNMTPAYLSKLFKNYTGKSILDYINTVRIQKAKELLQNEEFTIAQIADKVGFVNSNAIIRIFKKYEGITPGKYKEMLKKARS